MNNTRRKKTMEVITSLKGIIPLIEHLYSEEEYAFDSLSDSLQCTSKGNEMQECIESYESAIDSLNDVVNYLEEIIL